MKTWLLGRGIDSNRYIRRLFREQPQLVPLLRNPFTAELIAEYACTSGGEQLPENMFAVFDRYISERLNNDQPTLHRLNLSPGQVRTAAALIAKRMYESGDVGLEADVDQIASILQDTLGDQASRTIEALRYVRIARVGGDDRRRFSFVHRRFAEFFVVEGIRSTSEFIDVKAIPTDSRWRDCLVMYCGIVELPVRQRIADYCWSIIAAARDKLQDGRIGAARDAIHCIRFLADAFRSDVDALEGFRQQLGEVVVQLLESTDLLTAKIGAEGIPLIDEVSQQQAITLAFRSESPWVCDTALGTCRHLNILNQATNDAIRSYLRSIPMLELIRRFDDFNFSLSLSDTFRGQRWALWADLVGSILLITSAVIIFGFAAIYSYIYLAMSMLMAGFLIVGLNITLSILPRTALHTLSVYTSRQNTIRIYENFRRKIVRSNDALFMCMQWYIISSAYVWLILPSISKRFISVPHVHTQVLFRKELDPLIIFVIIMMAFLGWELPFIALRNINKTRSVDIIFASVKALGIFGVIVGISFGLVWVVPKIWMILPLEIRAIFTTVVEMIDKALPSILVVIGSVLILGILGWVLLWLVPLLIERRKMYQRGFPSSVTSQAVYEACLSFRSVESRRLFLEGLRQRRVPLNGGITAPPSALLKDRLVAEELARLHEQWYGFSV